MTSWVTISTGMIQVLLCCSFEVEYNVEHDFAVRTTRPVHIATRRRLGKKTIRRDDARDDARYGGTGQGSGCSGRYAARGGCSALEAVVVHRVHVLLEVRTKVFYACSVPAALAVLQTALTFARVAVHDGGHHMALEVLSGRGDHQLRFHVVSVRIFIPHTSASAFPLRFCGTCFFVNGPLRNELLGSLDEFRASYRKLG